ncbi:MAG: polyprenyl synthetase family protein [Patescibacteria group bacterium]
METTTENELLNFLDENKKAVWNQVKKYLPAESNYPYHRMINEYPHRQGKYFRPALLMLSARLHGGREQDALPIAAALQISEDWLLIHDDVEDHSLERRHRLSLNLMYGEEAAINAGDALHLIMWKMIGDIARNHRGDTGFEIFDKFNETLMTTTEGQFMELNWIKNKIVEVSEVEYLNMVSKKTAAYTTTAPTQLAAIIAGYGSISTMNKIEEWTLPFGLAFQIFDDVMNVTETSQNQGKEFAGDIWEGKRTLILGHLLRSADAKEKQTITEIFVKNRESKTEDEIKKVLELMHKYGSMDYAKNLARQYAKQASDLFSGYSKNLPDQSAKRLIEQAIEFVVNRQK